MSDTEKMMKRNILSLRILASACAVGGIISMGMDFFFQWRTGTVPPSIFGSTAMLLIGICSFAVLGCLTAFDARLKHLERQQQVRPVQP
jgi:hypothetical protein